MSDPRGTRKWRAEHKCGDCAKCADMMQDPRVCECEPTSQADVRCFVERREDPGLKRLRSEVRRLRAWLQSIRRMCYDEVATNVYGPWVADMVSDALRGTPAPRRGR